LLPGLIYQNCKGGPVEAGLVVSRSIGWSSSSGNWLIPGLRDMMIPI